MSMDSGEGYARLADRLLDHDYGSIPAMPPPHISIPVAAAGPGVVGTGSTSSGTTSVRGGAPKQRGQKKEKKSRKMAWLLIHNTGELQTIHMDKRQLIQVTAGSAAANAHSRAVAAC